MQSELYPRLIQDVQLVINELGNVTVLWEELWLSTLQDLHTGMFDLAYMRPCLQYSFWVMYKILREGEIFSCQSYVICIRSYISVTNMQALITNELPRCMLGSDSSVFVH